MHAECLYTKHLKQQQNFQTTWFLCNTSLNTYFPIMQINLEIMCIIMIHTHTRNVPRALIWCIRSNFFISVSRVPVSEMALALFTRMSIPPNFFTASSTADLTCFSSRTSTTQDKHLPPTASTEIHVIHQYTRTYTINGKMTLPCPTYTTLPLTLAKTSLSYSFVLCSSQCTPRYN